MSVKTLEEMAGDVVQSLGRGAPVSLSVSDGVATLSGEVPDDDTRRRIEQGLLQIAELRDVHNHLTIKQPSGNLRDQLSALLAREDISLPGLEVEVDGGRIVLKGPAEHWFERDAAERLAWTLQGVGAVDNRISLPEGAATPENGEDAGLPE